MGRRELLKTSESFLTSPSLGFDEALLPKSQTSYSSEYSKGPHERTKVSAVPSVIRRLIKRRKVNESLDAMVQSNHDTRVRVFPEAYVPCET